MCLSLQIFSLAATVSLPLLVELPENYKTYAIYGIAYLLSSVNAHGILQQRNIINPNFLIETQSYCFIIMMAISAYIYLQYSIAEPKS